MNKLNTFALTLLITGAIDSIRNLPATALFGSSVVFFMLLGAIFFLIPTALVSAELAANVDKGGIYQWGKEAFGERVGFLGVWLQWINNVIWFPTILSFIAGSAAYIISPELSQNKYYLITMILGLFWFLTLINLRGIRLSAKFTSFCAISGLVLPMALIITLLIIWLMIGKPTQIQFTPTSMLPNFSSQENWIAMTAIIVGFCGMELATVHINDVKKPRKTFPRALGYSTLIILITMLLGSLAIAAILPYNQINLVNGTIQSFVYFLTAFHLSWVIPILTISLIVGSLGGVVSWVISPAKGLCQAAESGFLPRIFMRKNAYHAPHIILITQAILVSLVCVAFLLLPSVNASYWFLTALSTQLYMLMYILMFVAALKLRQKYIPHADRFLIPGKKLGLGLICLLGLLGCTATLVIGFIPPSTLNIGSSLRYELFFCAGLISLLLPVLFFFNYAKRHQKISDLGEIEVNVLNASATDFQK